MLARGIISQKSKKNPFKVDLVRGKDDLPALTSSLLFEFPAGGWSRARTAPGEERSDDAILDCTELKNLDIFAEKLMIFT